MERDETMFTVKPLPSAKERDEALVIGLFEGANSWSGLAGEYDARLGGWLSELQKEGDISAKRGRIATVHPFLPMGAKRLYFVGLGKKEELTFERLREVFGKLFRALKQAKRTKAAVALDTFTTEAVDGNEAAHALAEAYHLATYEFPGYKQKKSEPDYQLESLIVYTAAEAAEIEASLFVGSGAGRTRHYGRGVHRRICGRYAVGAFGYRRHGRHKERRRPRSGWGDRRDGAHAHRVCRAV